MSIFRRRKEPTPSPPPNPARVALDRDQRYLVSMALTARAEMIRGAVAAAEYEPASMASKLENHRDRMFIEADDAERIASLFRAARTVEVSLEAPSAVVSTDDSRERELAELVEAWSTTGVTPAAIAALLFRSGVRMFRNIGAPSAHLIDRLAEMYPDTTITEDKP